MAASQNSALSSLWKLLPPLSFRHVSNAAADDQWLRVVMNRELERRIRAMNPESKSALEISGYAWAVKGGFKTHRSVDYPAFDICKDRLAEQFDIVIAEQVFEHLLWP